MRKAGGISGCQLLACSESWFCAQSIHWAALLFFPAFLRLLKEQEEKETKIVSLIAEQAEEK